VFLKNLLINLGIILAAGSALAFREVDLLLHPRFWAEEASVYFLATLGDPGFLSNLLASHQGFFSLTANLAGWLATRLPMEQAPLASLGVGFTLQMLPFLIVATGRSELLAAPFRRLIACLVLLVFGAAGELHLNTAISHFHYTLVGMLIYLELGSPLSPRRGFVLLTVLALAGLSNVQACTLGAALAWRWYQRRQRRDAMATLVLAAATAVQVLAVMARPLAGSGDPFHPARRCGRVDLGVRSVTGQISLVR
jgi:hypothetical protein